MIGDDDAAAGLYREAVSSAGVTTVCLKLKFSQAVAQNLPPSLAATVAQLPALSQGKPFVVVCSEFSCKPPVFTAEQLKELLAARNSAA